MERKLPTTTRTKPSFLVNHSVLTQNKNSKITIPPLYPFRKPNFNFSKKKDGYKRSRGEAIREAAKRTVFGQKSTLKRFNSSNGIRLHEQSTRDGDEEEETKLPSYTRTPVEL